MTIVATVTGYLIADPARRIGRNGQATAVAQIASALDRDTTVCVIAYGGVAEQLAALGRGDKLAVVGHARVDT